MTVDAVEECWHSNAATNVRSKADDRSASANQRPFATGTAARGASVVVGVACAAM